MTPRRISLLAAVILAAPSLASFGVELPQAHVTYIERSRGWGSAMADFDGDGHEDIFVTGHDLDDRIWYWTPTGYVPSPNVFPYVDRHDCDAADVDRDGRVDLYCAVGAFEGTGLGPNELWMQGPNGRFVAATAFGAEDPSGRGRIPLFFDLDHDGYPDLYLENEATPRVDNQLPNFNHVYLNRRDGTFQELATVATGNKGYACARKGDIDGDGWDDLVVCNLYGPSHIYINNHALDFVDLAAPPLESTWKDARLVDMNNDGLLDLVLIAHGNTLQVWLNSGQSPYFERLAYSSALPGIAVSLTTGDFDHDGHQDVYVVLQDPDCLRSEVDLAPDVVYFGRGNEQWEPMTLPQDYAGCGHLADTLDGDRILLENGTHTFEGPNYVIRFAPAVSSP